MKQKPLVLFLLILLHYSVFAQLDKPEEKIREIANKYFAVSPEGLNLSLVIEKLKSNIHLETDTVINKTDTSLFYFRGYTTAFNPFNTPIQKIEIQIREDKVNGTNIKDTILVFMIIAITDSSLQSKQNLANELRNIVKDISPVFSRTEHRKSSKKDKLQFDGYSFYYLLRSFPYLTIGWNKYYQNHKVYSLNLTLLYRNIRE
ncbi:MAG: hypothetical protein ACRDEB_00840 [Chitinophagaceae bacterium]